jgi:hypothetical protein
MSLATDIMKAKAIRDELYALERRISERSQRMGPITPNDEADMRNMQARADEVYESLGRRAPPYLPLERPEEYRRRLLEPMKECSSDWRSVDLNAVDDATLNRIEPQLFAAARADALCPHDLKPGEMREIMKRDERTGHTISTFVGRDTHFVKQFTRPARRVKFRSWNEYMAMSANAATAALARAMG